MIREYGKNVRITRDMLLADDCNYYQNRFFKILKQSRIAAEQFL